VADIYLGLFRIDTRGGETAVQVAGGGELLQNYWNRESGKSELWSGHAKS